ncbi:VWA domain-containing protein [Treponema rectale]|uniref:Ca-activated chloride channel family protein n=1 Tax=Treponema rectale TaxID=744512 RepID=A0A840SGL0_9SPIR|nr:VWA domain-containing protein [Treponema rectale]MBB5219298.1 Ca-activated chloride channel family protein [Treponema rectale]QOS40817.1 VWA domain-containing protein [Treponema rectale]
MIQFENPFAFLLLFLIPVLYFLRYIKFLSRISFSLVLSDWEGESFKWKKKSRIVISIIVKLCLLATYVCVIIALASPVIRHHKKIFSSRGADILFVLDVSPSMASIDIAGMNRLEAAKTAIKKIAASDEGDCFGLVEVAKEAAMVVPLTMDRDVFFNKLSTVAVGELGDGTALGLGLSAAIYHLEHSSSKSKCIVLITDGENNAGSVHPNTAARLAMQKDIALFVLGVGTKGTVPLEYTDPQTGKFYSGFFESNYDSSSLMNIAQESDGKFYEVETIQALIQAFSSISKRENVAQTYNIKNEDKTVYYYFIMLAFILVSIAWFLKRLVLQEVL